MLDGDGGTEWVLQTAALPYDAELRGETETVGAPAAEGGVESAEQMTVPGFETLLVVAHHTVGTPPWLTSWHLLSAFVGVVVSLEGAGRVYTERGGVGESR